jgi:hypothetical protein
MSECANLLQFGESSLCFCGFYRQEPIEAEIMQVYNSLSLIKALSWEVAIVDLLD